MRHVLLSCALFACGSVKSAPDAAVDGSGTIDAPMIDALTIDAPPDACVPTPVFLGGMDPVAQGWTVNKSGAATISTAGPSITSLVTTTTGTSGAYQLLSKAGLVTPGQPFDIELNMQVNAVNPHNSFDGAAVLMARYSGGFGDGTDRAQMLYVDGDRLGWTDDTASFLSNSLDGAFHTYRLKVDSGGNATVYRDGISVLTRVGYVTNGTLAFGDQTNDANIESSLYIRSLTLRCP